jgi:8-oxo-dGTP pyrophosphatase MutT (NUDIX family)
MELNKPFLPNESENNIIQSLLIQFNISQQIHYILQTINSVYKKQLYNNLLNSIQELYWKYLDDFIIPNIISFDFKGKTEKFMEYCFKHFAVFAPIKQDYNIIYDRFKAKIDNIPVAGTILVNHDKTKVIMIKTKRGKYDFPKGKIEKLETIKQTAIRETIEEVGYDCTNNINHAKIISFKVYNKHIESTSVKKVTMFIIHNVDESFPFKSKTSIYEVDSVSWVPINNIKLPYIFRKSKFNIHTAIQTEENKK